MWPRQGLSPRRHDEGAVKGVDVERRDQDGWVEWDANSWFGACSGELVSRRATGMWLASHLDRREAAMVRMGGAWTVRTVPRAVQQVP